MNPLLFIQILEFGILLGCTAVFLGTFWDRQKKEWRKKLEGKALGVSAEYEDEDKIKEIRFNGRLYDVTSWIPRHPGGRVIEYYVNNADEDATEAITQFHHCSFAKVRLILQSLPSRPIPHQMLDVSEKHLQMSKDFQELYTDLKAEGYFEPSLVHVWLRILELVALVVVGMICLKYGSIYWLPHSNSWAWVLAGIVLLSLFQMRVAYFMHEAGHHSLTGQPGLDRLIQAVVFGLGSGQSASWYRYHHTRHHAMPQRLHHDNDIDTLPGIAVNVKVVDDPKTSVNFFLRHQARLVVPVGATIGVTSWKLYLHPQYVLQRRLYTEAVCMFLHYVIALKVIGLLPYAISVIISISFVILNLSLSHTHLPVTEEPRHWVEYALVHTMNINPSWWCDWWTGYLNYQIEHHLFPSMPGFRQAQVRERVRELAKRHNLPYICESYLPTCFATYNNMKNVAQVLVKLANN